MKHYLPAFSSKSHGNMLKLDGDANTNTLTGWQMLWGFCQ